MLRWGTNADVVSLLRSTALSADTELSGIIEGTSDHPGVAANSLIISNITDDGDIMFVVSDGGNSKGLLKLDGQMARLLFTVVIWKLQKPLQLLELQHSMEM